MNPDENLDLYHSFSDKLGASKKQIDVDDSIRFSFEEQRTLHLTLKSIQDQDSFKLTINFLYLLGSLVFIMHIVLVGWWIGAIGLFLLTLFYVTSKILLTKQLRKTTTSFYDIEKKGLLEESDLIALKSYNRSIIGLKLLRIQILIASSVLLVPLIFLSIYEILFHDLSLIITGLAILLGSFFWMIFFYKDQVELNVLKDRVSII